MQDLHPCFAINHTYFLTPESSCFTSDNGHYWKENEGNRGREWEKADPSPPDRKLEV